MRETESLGLNSPHEIVVFLMYIIFLVICFLGLESIDYTKILRKEYYNRGILLHTLLSIALAYLVTNFFLAVLFKA